VPRLPFGTPCLPLGTTVIPTARRIADRLRVAIERDPIEQGVAERLAKAGFASGLLWVAIWWALS
jgi:hypothetical protein